MKLHYRKMGSGEPLLVIHGLYGSSDNWLSLAKKFSESFEVYLIDLRNHGRSPQTDSFGYEYMQDDLLEFMEGHNLEKIHIIGHSMGGKLAMYFAARYPEYIRSLVVVDIAPSMKYRNNKDVPGLGRHKNIIEGLMAIPIKKLADREEADRKLSGYVPEKPVRQFLLKNLKRDITGSYNWKLNLPALKVNLSEIMGGVDHELELHTANLRKYPVLFIRGEESDYLLENDIPLVKYYYPQAEIVAIPEAGHWVHAEQPEKFLETSLAFLKKKRKAQ